MTDGGSASAVAKILTNRVSIGDVGSNRFKWRYRDTLHAISRALGHLRDANAAQARLNSYTTLPCYITYSRSGNSSAEPSGGACAASTSRRA